MSSKPTPQQLEERLRALIVENRYLEGLIGDFQTRMSLVDAAIREYNTTEATIGGLKEMREDDEILVPMGGGSFLKAKIADTQRVVIGVGAGMTVEKTNEEAKATVQQQINQLQKIRSTLENQLLQAVQRLEAVRDELNKMAGSVRT